MLKQLRICSSCVLPDTFPSIDFDSQGVCNYCRDAASAGDPRTRFAQLASAMADAIRIRKSDGAYDCVVAYSGGKDSTFTLKLLIEKYDLRCLAVTIDNGFMSEQAKINCSVVTSNLGVDHMLFKPATNFMNTMYAQSARKKVHANAAIKRASSMCNSCINLINVQMIKFAVRNEAPIVAGGYIGGQVPKDAAMMELDLDVLARSRQNMESNYVKFFGEEAFKYMSLDTSFVERSSFKNILIINPMLTVAVTEEQILEEISELGWSKTQDTGQNSSNCRLNDLGIAVHFKQHGFNPYVFEISEQVRNGLMTRDVALAKANSIPEFAEVEWQAGKIGLNLDEF